MRTQLIQVFGTICVVIAISALVVRRRSDAFAQEAEVRQRSMGRSTFTCSGTIGSGELIVAHPNWVLGSVDEHALVFETWNLMGARRKTYRRDEGDHVEAAHPSIRVVNRHGRKVARILIWNKERFDEACQALLRCGWIQRPPSPS